MAGRSSSCLVVSSSHLKLLMRTFPRCSEVNYLVVNPTSGLKVNYLIRKLKVTVKTD